MAGQTIIIRGGTLVTAYRMVQADLWIEDGVIRRIGKETLQIRRTGNGRQLKIFDATGYYVLPGLILLSRLSPSELQRSVWYKEQIRHLIRRGVTAVLHTQRLDSWMERGQIRYHLTPHYNSSIDYGIRMGLDASMLTRPHLRMLKDLGFRLFEVTIHRYEDLMRIDWLPLYQLAAQERLSIHLHIPVTAPLTSAERSDAIELWTADCLHGQIRTWVADKGLHLQPRHEGEMFYRVVQVHGSQLSAALGFLSKNWYTYFPAFCPIDHWTPHLSVREYGSEQLLQLLVRLASTNIAKAIGWYPRKGSLLSGADADLWLLKKAEWLTNFDLSTMLNLSEVCLPAFVMSKGRWIYRHDTYSDVVGAGRYLQEMRPYHYAI
ncbi:amidohydrolase family protein [Brevibacillus humidisoli]|uniref:amidohydrolase family protein n=1 Tax=Brevibacillus humidisoli TaxID=2895522 RepID=UPI001E5314E5|nr:amidohydrolase family protein [Brevibacillus humidisoli]UFJ42765.1 amidohydrolase family protein [Brevibacillus humidisoli]